MATDPTPEESTTPEAQPSRPSLESLIQQYQAGEAAAAAALVEHASPRIFQFLLAQVRNVSLAEDLLQDFWLRIHKARHTYRIGEPVWPWLFAIARHVQIDGYRRRSRISHHELQTETLPENFVAKSNPSFDHNVSEMLTGLPANQREAVLLLKVVGLSLEETARAVGISVGAVKQRAHRALQTLRSTFGGQYE